MSEWRGLHNPEKHIPTDVSGDNSMAWCSTCEGPRRDEGGCWGVYPCRCCLEGEIEREKTRAEKAEGLVRKARALAHEEATQPTDWDDDTEARIDLGMQFLAGLTRRAGDR